MRYFLAHNEIDIFHYGELSEEQVVTTGQPKLEYYDDLNGLTQRLNFYGIQYIENNEPINNNLDSPEMENLN